MQFSVPQRRVADSGSFPVEPDEVCRWLEELRPLASEPDARELLRGLRHSNRLHNDPARRRAVIERFAPVLLALHGQLAELARAQPLPLAREFARAAALAEALLREEAFAFKILLADAETPDPDDARRAMGALVRQAELAVNGYRRLPEGLLEDAHALFALVESGTPSKGSEAMPSSDDAETSASETEAASDASSLRARYAYLLLLCLVDTRQLRVRQLPLALDFLREAAASIEFRRTEEIDRTAGTRTFAVHLRRGAEPAPLASLLAEDPAALRAFDVGELLGRVDRRISRTRVARSTTLGVDVLERQTLGRLRAALGGERSRRGARRIVDLTQPLVFGQREIATYLAFVSERSAGGVVEASASAGLAVGARVASGYPDGPDATSVSPAPPLVPASALDAASSGWTMVNRSAQGLCLRNAAGGVGTVQVGELVVLVGTADRERGTAREAERRAGTLLGSVRWVRADARAGIALGVELLARGVAPVSVVRSDGAESIGERALLIACKVRRATVQTILLPPYLYEPGERLTATRDGRSKRIRLQSCLQTNGLYAHFLLG